MTVEEIRLACLEQALRMRQSPETIEERVETFARYVTDDPVKLKCLCLAMASVGMDARRKAASIVDHAIAYHKIVRKPEPEEKALRRRGRQRK
jgi:hypothetical protein